MWYNLLKTANLNKKIDILSKRYNIDEYTLLELSYADPSSPKYIYMEWLTKLYINKNIRIPEDINKIKEELDLFEKLKRSPKFNGEKNIHAYKTFGDLAETVNNNTDSLSNQEKFRIKSKKGQNTIFDNGTWKIIQINTREASEMLCDGTKWCVKDPAIFDEYEPPLYLFIKNDQRIALLHFPTDQFMDVYDNPIITKIKSNIYSKKPDYSKYGKMSFDQGDFKDINNEVELLYIIMQTDLKDKFLNQFGNSLFKIYNIILNEEQIKDDIKNDYFRKRNYYPYLEEIKDIFSNIISNEEDSIIGNYINKFLDMSLIHAKEFKNINEKIVQSYLNKYPENKNIILNNVTQKINKIIQNNFNSSMRGGNSVSYIIELLNYNNNLYEEALKNNKDQIYQIIYYNIINNLSNLNKLHYMNNLSPMAKEIYNSIYQEIITKIKNNESEKIKDNLINLLFSYNMLDSYHDIFNSDNPKELQAINSQLLTKAKTLFLDQIKSMSPARAFYNMKKLNRQVLKMDPNFAKNVFEIVLSKSSKSILDKDRILIDDWVKEYLPQDYINTLKREYNYVV